MIQVSLETLIIFYLVLLLSIILGAWLWFEFRRQKRENRSARHRLRCSLCAFEFVDDSTNPLPKCPRCGSLNERLPYSTL